MDCSEFIWHCGADPSSQDLAFLRHREACEKCAWVHRREMRFNARLHAALSLSAPPHLVERLSQISDS